MKIQFGSGRRCINPPMPISLAGYFNRRVWTEVLDDLEVRALVLKDGENLAVILHLDILSIPHLLYCDIWEALEKLAIPSIKKENVIIAATHTHTAPNTVQEAASPEYRKFAAEMAAEALKDAMKEFREGEVLSGMISDIRFLFNRRYWMKDGRVVTNPGKLNKDILRPEGEIDPEIPLIAIKTSAGLEVLISSIVNHTDTIGGCGVSADWPGFLRRAIEKEMAPGAMYLPMIGASGNINHFDNSTAMDQTCYAEARRIGEGYAESIRKALPKLVPISGSGMKMAVEKVVSFPRELDAEEVAQAQSVMEKYPEIDLDAASAKDITSEDLAKGTPFALKYFANALLKIAGNTRRPEFLLSCIRFGDSTILATLPSEPFVELGLTVRKEIFRDSLVLLSSHGNYNGGEGFIGGYIPNAWNYKRGGYEDTPRSSTYSVRTSALLMEGWRKLAEKIK